jgi:hypothetical protein
LNQGGNQGAAARVQQAFLIWRTELLCDSNSRQDGFLSIKCSEIVVGNLGNCAKLLEKHAGEVAERLKAAVC